MGVASGVVSGMVEVEREVKCGSGKGIDTTAQSHSVSGSEQKLAGYEKGVASASEEDQVEVVWMEGSWMPSVEELRRALVFKEDVEFDFLGMVLGVFDKCEEGVCFEERTAELNTDDEMSSTFAAFWCDGDTLLTNWFTGCCVFSCSFKWDERAADILWAKRNGLLFGIAVIGLRICCASDLSSFPNGRGLETGRWIILSLLSFGASDRSDVKGWNACIDPRVSESFFSLIVFSSSFWDESRLCFIIGLIELGMLPEHRNGRGGVVGVTSSGSISSSNGINRELFRKSFWSCFKFFLGNKRTIGSSYILIIGQTTFYKINSVKYFFKTQIDLKRTLSHKMLNTSNVTKCSIRNSDYSSIKIINV